MPQIAPWLRPAQPAPLYLQGVGLGLRGAQQRQSAAQAAAALAAQQAESQRQAEIQAARMQVQQEIAKQEMALKQQEMGIAAQQLAGRQAMQESDIAQNLALRRAQEEYRSRVAAGEDKLSAMAAVAPFAQAVDALAIQQRAQEAAAKAKTSPWTGGPIQAAPVVLGGKQLPGWFALPSATGSGLTAHQTQPSIRPEVMAGLQLRQQSMVASINEKIDKLIEENPDLTSDQPPESERRKKAWTAGRKSIEKYNKQIDDIMGMPLSGQSSGAVLEYDPATGTFKRVSGASLSDMSQTIPSGVTPAEYPAWPTEEE